MSDPAAMDREAQTRRKALDPFFTQVGRVLVGQNRLVERIVIGLLTGGHLLLEGVPGLAKTLAVRTAARALSLSFARIQFTPDLLPADVIGTQVFQPRTGDFAVRPGPVFANLVLADEINRAPAKVQSALLEAMQELQVTIGDSTLTLPQPFLVLATQNPIEQEGTYPLPEAQLDRFLFKVKLDYPSKDEELAIVERMAPTKPPPTVEPVLGSAEIASLRTFVDGLYVDAKIKQYCVDLVRATRHPTEHGLDLSPLIQYGAGPRASLGLVWSARALAFLHGRGYVVPHDVKEVAPDVLRHRIIVSYEAEADGVDTDEIVKRLLGSMPVP